MKANNIIIKVLAATLAVTSFSSCQEKIGGGFTKGEPVRFSAGTDATDTKAAYSGVATDGIERIDWEAGDLIRIYCAAASEPATKYADYAVTTGTITPDGAKSKAQIEAYDEESKLCWGDEGVAHTFYAVAPSASIAKPGSNVIATANVKALQTPGTALTAAVTVAAGETRKIDADMTNMFMAAKSIEYYPESGISADNVFLSFTPLTTAIEFTITNGTTNPMIFKSVALISGKGKTSAEPVINGEFSIDLDTWAKPADAKPADESITVSYGKEYPACTGTATSTDETDRTVTIDFGKEITLAAKSGDTPGGSLTFTFFLTPTHNFEDLSLKLTKSNDSWMSTRLAYTDGSGVFFPRFKKSTVTGLFLPEGAQWTVKYAPIVNPWNQESQNIDPMPGVNEGETLVTSWDTGTSSDLDLLPVLTE